MSWKLTARLKRILQDEEGAIVRDWGGKTSIALVYPNTYAVGMANLAVHALYGILNRYPNVVCERAFLPAPSDMREYARTATPVMSLETQQPLGSFDVIAFTVSFENDLLNIIPLLECARIPHRVRERTDEHPLIIAGGAAVTLNPQPLAHIVDAAISGEFEAFADDFLAELAETAGGRAVFRRTHGREIVDTDMLPGVKTKTIPRRPRPFQLGMRTALADLDAFPTQTVIWTRNAQFGNMHLIELMRGCGRKCSFCAVPGLYGPPRPQSFDAVMKMIDNGFAHRKAFGLIGADILSHPRFTLIAESILRREGRFSLSSVRVDRITPDIARLIAQGGTRSLSLGIEAGTETLRMSLGKALTDERCMESIAYLASAGITNLRLYFMIGLPGETDDDIDAIPAFAVRARDEIRKYAPRTRRTSSVELTITPFVPKRGSGFGNESFAGIARINAIQKKLKRHIGAHRDVRVSFDAAQQAAVEAYLATAGPEAIGFLEEAHRTSLRAALKKLRLSL